MAYLDEKAIGCPYCGETIVVLVDPQEAGHEYIEDCQVCCKPIVFSIQIDSEGQVEMTARSENEA